MEVQYLDFIANNYNKIKSNISKESIKKLNIELDEDIFHDTILKCIKICDKLDLTVDQLSNYIFISYKTNYLREQEYARNKNRDDIDLSLIDDCKPDKLDIDYEKMKYIIIDQFGDNEWKLFEDYIYGASISDISKENHETGLYYRFNKIKNYAKKFIQK
jgi:hypothetical protein